jgi:tetratricopeptide (TPR) repeat protein
MPAKVENLRNDIRELMKKGGFNEVVDRCHLELTMARRERQREVEITALLGLADAQCSLGHFGFARDYATQSVELSLRIRATGLHVDALNIRARVAREGYLQTTEAHQDYMDAVNFAHEAGDMRRYGLSILGLGEISLQVGESAKHAWKVIDIARDLGDKDLEARAVLLLANSFIRKGDYDKANDGLLIALGLAKTSGARLLESVIIGQQGLVLVQDQATFQKGIEQQMTALEVARGMEATFHEFMRLYTLAMTMISIHDMGEARNYFDQMLALSQDVQHKPYEMYTLGMFGHWQELNKKPDIAISYYTQASDMARDVSNPQYQARYLYAVGTVYASQWDFDMARSYYNDAKDLYQSLDDGQNSTRVTASIVYSYLLAFASQIMKLVGMQPNKTE